MKQSLRFEQIRPFVRYARFLELNGEISFPPFISYDARILYTYRGQGEVSADGKKYNMQKGSVLLWQSAVPYELISPDEGAVAYIALNFDFTYAFCGHGSPVPPDTKGNFAKKKVFEDINFTDMPLFNKPVYLYDMQMLEQDFLEIIEEFTEQKRFFSNKISSLLQGILVELARCAMFINRRNEKLRSKADEIVSFIHSHYSEDLNNKKMGKLFHYHPNYVNHLIVMRTGQPLHRYLLTLRISKAVSLLESTALSTKEISEAVGFKDVCHFSRYFKKITGSPPGCFRKMKN